jgi:hypothetical protein
MGSSGQRTPASDLPGDQLAARALNTATLGLYTVPVVLHLYSAWLLVRLKMAGHLLSAGGVAQVREAWRINALILIGAALCVAVLARLYWGS